MLLQYIFVYSRYPLPNKFLTLPFHSLPYSDAPATAGSTSGKIALMKENHVKFSSVCT